MDEEKILECANKMKKYCSERKCEKCVFKRDYFRCRFMDKAPGLWVLPEKQILDDMEKEYLWNLIKPFKNKVKYIRKMPCFEFDEEYIEIKMQDVTFFDLPNFEKDKMYIGMKLNKKYTVKELFGEI